LDLGSVIGVVLGLALIVGSILLDGSILTFYNLPSILIVIGGTIAGLFVAYPMEKVKAAFKVAQKAFKGGSINYQESINQIVEIANVARREGLLALEEAASKIDDDFLKKGIMLIVDGTDPELVRNILETELAFIDERHGEGRSIFDALGAFAPAFGMIGTLIGLINMLQSLEDPTSVGPKMSVALITTFYGAVLANLVFIPIATKLKLRSKEEMLIKEVMVEGLLSIQAGENPRIIEVKLESFLPPGMRKGLGDGSEGAEG
jgi:chemotaxis protein MotA